MLGHWVLIFDLTEEGFAINCFKSSVICDTLVSIINCDNVKPFNDDT